MSAQEKGDPWGLIEHAAHERLCAKEKGSLFSFLFRLVLPVGLADLYYCLHVTKGAWGRQL